MSLPPSPARRGSSLLEAVIAAGLLTTVLAAVFPLVATSTVAVATTRDDLLAAHLARQRLSQLQALINERSPVGAVVDEHSRLDEADLFAIGGSGLAATGLGPLMDTTAPWADWLDARGAWLSGGSAPPPGARFRRRWGILAAGPEECRHVWVEVVPIALSYGDRTAHAGGVQCPWGAGAP